MAIRKIARMGHPILREKARELDPTELKTDWFERLIEDMSETMDEYGGIGLAAPQVHEPVAVALLDYQENHPRYADQTQPSSAPKSEALTSVPRSVFVNPKITVLDPTEQGYWEGCLSIPEIRGLVYRPRKIKVDYLDRQGRAQSLVAEGFLATVFQHELDHLYGTLFVDRIRYEPGKSPITFSEEYARFHLPHEDGDIGELED